MGKAWILDTDTKGTGAQMVPLEKLRDDAAPRAPVVVRRKPARPRTEPAPKPPREFKVIDVMSRRVLVEGADARSTVHLLRRIRSIVDVGVYVWRSESETWRMLSHREKKMLWEAAQRPPTTAAAESPGRGEDP